MLSPFAILLLSHIRVATIHHRVVKGTQLMQSNQGIYGEDNDHSLDSVSTEQELDCTSEVLRPPSSDSALDSTISTACAALPHYVRLRSGTQIVLRDDNSVHIGVGEHAPALFIPLEDRRRARRLMRIMHSCRDGMRVRSLLWELTAQWSVTWSVRVVRELIRTGGLQISLYGEQSGHCDPAVEGQTVPVISGGELGRILAGCTPGARLVEEVDSVGRWRYAQHSPCVIVGIDQPDPALLRQLHEHRIGYLPCAVRDDSIRMGPVVLPGHTEAGCPLCRSLWGGTRRVDRQLLLDPTRVDVAIDHALGQMMRSLVRMEHERILAWLSYPDLAPQPVTVSHAVTYVPRESILRRTPVRPHPQCVVCGNSRFMGSPGGPEGEPAAELSVFHAA